MTNTNALILVIGATGTVGSEITKQLVEAGQTVRVLARDPAKAKIKFGATVEIFQGDLSKPETLAAAFVGVDGAYVLLPAIGPEFPELEGNAFNAAKRAGVKRIVKQSSFVMEDFMAGTPFAEWHGESEKRLCALGVAWTILRPAFFASNFVGDFAIMRQGGLFLPTGDGKDAPIDPRDVAAVAVKVLTTAGHEGKIYSPTGPELLSYAEVVQKVAAVTGKPLKFVDVPEAKWREDMLSAGAPLPVVESLLAYFTRGIKAGRIQVRATVPSLLGRPARTLEQWAKDHIAELNQTK